MSRLFNRRAVITIATKGVEAFGEQPARRFECGKDGFDCRFDIHKDLTGKPNRATVDIFNLNQEHRDDLSERAAKGPVRVRVEAGYEKEIHRIFEGDIRIVEHKRQGADFVTYFESGDGDHIISTARVSKAWASGTSVDTVIHDLALLLGIGEGNLKTSIIGTKLESGPTFTGGTAASGRVAKVLTKLCVSAGFTWSIQDGTLQFLVTDKALSTQAILVTPATGMEGAATIVAPRGKRPRALHVKMRLIPAVFPGRKIMLEDRSVWRVDKAHYSGNTRGSNWNIDVQARVV